MCHSMIRHTIMVDIVQEPLASCAKSPSNNPHSLSFTLI